LSSIIDFRAYVDPTIIPIVVFVDLQQEYLASSRALAIPSAPDALVHCRAALAHARRIGWPLAFVRWAGRSPFFNQATRFSRWIEGFEPTGVDMIFERGRPSCYASPEFSEVVASSGGNLVLAGFAGEAACLSTAVDAFHRSHRLTYLSDASASHGLDDMSGNEMHAAIAKIIGIYADVISTNAWIAATSRRERAYEKPRLVNPSSGCA
jgi:nicotinamidase-related amidase